jgi:opacity protein-like surface antigen
MKKLLLISTAFLAFAAMPAKADVIIDNHLSGTGDNVVFDSFNAVTNVAVGSFNGQHTGLVDFSCIGGCGGFTGAANGNDIKIANTNDLKIQVFNSAGTIVLPTQTDVFSLKGTGDAVAFVIADEVGGGQKLFTFDLGTLSLSAQSGFTLSAINGEVIDSFRVATTGNLTDFEHYRIDIAAPLAAVPETATWAMMILGFFGIGGLSLLRRREGHGFRLA